MMAFTLALDTFGSLHDAYRNSLDDTFHTQVIPEFAQIDVSIQYNSIVVLCIANRIHDNFYLLCGVGYTSPDATKTLSNTQEPQAELENPSRDGRGFPLVFSFISWLSS
ncbi:hypothetical protein FOYG_11217 [Fusarium oxysporum NRRL 32931]|uniref:Uncharacterized protein n=1 Tax=Fusarium oxysporum NRRL 32931 TaxID=660029 RepID=W9HWY9_FUSOX|nr:hypothetical protein FOYG_11217 [Fusarium oxysporum NRRL 32931]